MRPLSMDLRKRVAAACDEGLDTRAEIAERFSVGESWIRRLLQRRRDTGSLAPRAHRGGRPPAFDSGAAQRLRDAVKANPDATPRGLREAVGVACSISAIDRTPRRLRLPWKKGRRMPPSRTGRT